MQLKYVDTKEEIIAVNKSQNILNHIFIMHWRLFV